MPENVVYCQLQVLCAAINKFTVASESSQTLFANASCSSILNIGIFTCQSTLTVITHNDSTSKSWLSFKTYSLCCVILQNPNFMHSMCWTPGTAHHLLWWMVLGCYPAAGTGQTKLNRVPKTWDWGNGSPYRMTMTWSKMLRQHWSSFSRNICGETWRSQTFLIQSDGTWEGSTVPGRMGSTA